MKLDNIYGKFLIPSFSRNFFYSTLVYFAPLQFPENFLSMKISFHG